MSKVTALRRMALYRAGSADLRRRLTEAAMVVRLEPGEMFFREGDVCESFAIVDQGDIRVFKAEPNGREISLYHVLDGQPCLMNTLSILQRRPTPASARVEVPTDAVCFDAATFRAWIHSDPDVREFVFATMATRLVDFMTLIEEVAFRKMDLRLAELLQRRFARGGLPGRTIPVTHEELASELGTAREVVSRLLKDFERSGMLVLTRGRLELKNEALLRKVTGAEVAGKD
jgi:CRP/FNR family transcriptional regulator